ncbi:MAG: hypothetical protein AAF590_06715 [Pseudomonadota bacterium]
MLDEQIKEPTPSASVDVTPRAVPKGRSRIRLRPLERRDIEAVFVICKAAHERAPARVFKFSRTKFDGHIEAYFHRTNQQAAIVAEIEGRIVGFAWMRCGTFTYSDEDRLASVLTLNVDHATTAPFTRARLFSSLISACKAVAEDWGALQTTVHVTSGMDAGHADRLLRRRGAEFVGGNYVL